MGRKWSLAGSIWKSGKRLFLAEKTLPAGSESDLEAAEKKMRAELFEKAVELLGKTDLKDVKIEVEMEID